jgi:hypothetical protein
MEVTYSPQDRVVFKPLLCPLGLMIITFCSNWSEDKMFHVMEREVTVFFLKRACESLTSLHVFQPDPIHV